MSDISTKPYLLRAIHEWCSDSGFTPYIAVTVDENTIVPVDFVRAGEIVLNISLSATNRLAIGNELIEFQARFGGVTQDLSIPVDNVSAIYARENGHGMAFEVAKPLAQAEARSPDEVVDPAPESPPGSESSDEAQDDAVSNDVGTKLNPHENLRPSLTAVPKSKTLEALSDQTDTDSEQSEPAPAPDDDGGGAPPPAGKRRGKPRLTRVK